MNADVKKVVKKDMKVRNNKRKQVETPNKGVGEVRMAKNRRLSTSKVGDKDDNVVDGMCYLEFLINIQNAHVHLCVQTFHTCINVFAHRLNIKNWNGQRVIISTIAVCSLCDTWRCTKGVMSSLNAVLVRGKIFKTCS